MSKMGDILFGTIERMHAGFSWGRFLDAGTGLHSVKWLQTLPTSSWTAITADNTMKNQVINDSTVASSMRLVDNVIVGNWMNESFEKSLGLYDTILADYLIGAVDGFSPYEQDTIIERLKDHLAPGGKMYFIGMSPIPDSAPSSADVICEIRRVRDACILLAGHRPYREFPSSWMKRHIERVGLKVTDLRTFTILHSEESAIRQLKVARSKLPYMSDKNVRDGMEKYINDLERRTREAIQSSDGRIGLSHDYVISAEHASSSNSDECSPPQPPIDSSSDKSNLV